MFERPKLSLPKPKKLYKEAGQGPMSIAEILGIHRATVYRWLRRYEETGGVKRQKGSSRPRKSTPDEDMALIRAAE